MLQCPIRAEDLNGRNSSQYTDITRISMKASG